MSRPNPPLSLLKPFIFALSLLPALRLAWAAHTGDFGPNPVEFVQRWTGTWTLNFLILTLCVSPLRVLTQWPPLLRLRRMLGLFTAFYAVLHVLAYIGFDHDFAVDAIARDMFKRPFVTAGLAAFLLVVPLALTSNAYAIRTLGGRRWQALHRAIYLMAILSCLHYLWLAKITELPWPLGYSVVVGVLLAWRIQDRRRRGQAARPPATRLAQAQPLRYFQEPPGRR